MADVSVRWIDFDAALRSQLRRGVVKACSPSAHLRFAELRRGLATSVQLMSENELGQSLDT